jgi:hypothetical protein
MFPDKHHIKIVKRIDAMESAMFTLYRQMERLRLDLQREWKVLPSDARWTQKAHDASEHSARPSATAEDAIKR